MINLDNCYRVTLIKNNRSLTQYIEAYDLDEAVKLASKTFDCNLAFKCETDMESFSKTTQKACKNTLLNEALQLGFNSGWITLYAKNQSIFEILELAKIHEFVNGANITEIKVK